MNSINADTHKNIYDGVENMILDGDYNQENLMNFYKPQRN